jgi:serine/threonine protein kinase
MDFSSLGKYEIRTRLGRGAMGVVYEGWDPVIRRRVAIKTTRRPNEDDPEDAEALSRFKREAQAAGRLSHPNIVGVYDYGETDDLAYIVMEFIDGNSLKTAMEEGQVFDRSEILRIMSALLAGLQYSHDHGVVHRDIKPANVMQTVRGEIKIADFGIARIESSDMTQAGAVMGTPAYMSPEQFLGVPVDPRTDIYSAGVLLYQLLSGRRPFDGTMSSIMHKVLHTDPAPLADGSRNIPQGIDLVVARAMARRPEDRFDNAAAFARALHDELDPLSLGRNDRPDDATLVQPARSPAPTAAPPAAAVSASRPRRKLLWPILLLCAVSALTAGSILYTQWPHSAETTKEASESSPAASREKPPNAAQAQDTTTPSSAPAATPDTTAQSTPTAPAETASAEHADQTASADHTNPTMAESEPPAQAAPVAPSSAEAAALGAGPPATDAERRAETDNQHPPDTNSGKETVLAANRPAAPPQAGQTALTLDMAQLRADDVACSILSVTGDAAAPDALRVSGLALPGASFQRFLKDLKSGDRRIDVTTDNLSATTCGVAGTVAQSLRSIPGGRSFRLTPFGTSLNAGSQIAVPLAPVESRAGSSAGSGNVYIDLYAADKTVRHLLQRAVSGDATIPITAPSQAGEYLLVTIQSSSPLELGHRPDRDSAANYLHDLQTAIARLPPENLQIATGLGLMHVIATPPQVHPAVAKPAPSPTRSLNAARCADIVGRVQLGETLSNADRTVLQTACRQ